MRLGCNFMRRAFSNTNVLQSSEMPGMALQFQAIEVDLQAWHVVVSKNTQAAASGTNGYHSVQRRPTNKQ